MTQRLVLLLLIAGSLMFGAIVLAELAPGAANDPVIAKVAAQPEAVAAIHRQQRPNLDEQVATALARPLFSSRRRPASTASAGNAVDGDLADKRLAGIVMTPARHIAIFAVNGDKPVHVSEGEDVSGWRVDSITAREVSLSGPSGTKVLQPKLDPNLAPPAAPAPIPNVAGRPPTPPRPPVPPVAAAAGQPKPALPGAVPGVPPRPGRLRQPR
jgi:hypothetical protein